MKYRTKESLLLNPHRDILLIPTAAMADASEEEEEEDFMPPVPKSSALTRPTRSEREEQLRKMMDSEGMSLPPAAKGTSTFSSNYEDDDEDENGQETAEKAPAELSQHTQGSSASEKDSPNSQDQPMLDAPPVAGDAKRRRGRRKVMKKKTLRDEEGYLSS